MWKDIEGFENRYQISDNGEVKNISKNTILIAKVDRDGYLEIALRKLGSRNKYCFRIHRLVAIAFSEKPENWMRLQIDHIDRNKQNNVITNLRWVTSQENNDNRKDTCWSRNVTTGQLHITKYKDNGYMLRINKHNLKHTSWHKTLEDAINMRTFIKNN